MVLFTAPDRASILAAEKGGKVLVAPLDRIATLHFIDGSKLSFEFPQQTPSAAARQIRFGDMLSSQHLVIEAEGQVYVFPVANIKYMVVSMPDFDVDEGSPASRQVIRGARIRG
jgi:hypothetical protein